MSADAPRFDFDLCDPTLFASGRHHAAFARLRREAPVHWHPEPDGPGFWAVTRHADVVRASRDPATFSSELGSTFIDDQTDEAMLQLRLTILNMDPPKHARYRRLVSRGFTPRMVGKLVDGVFDGSAGRLVAHLVEGGKLSAAELTELRELIDSSTTNNSRKGAKAQRKSS